VKRGVTPEFVSMSKEILYPKFRVLQWAHRTGPVHCPVRRHVTQPLGFGSSRPLAPLSSCGTGQVLFTVRCVFDFATLTLRALFFTVALSAAFAVDRCAN
jgi:hypothetical protein